MGLFSKKPAETPAVTFVRWPHPFQPEYELDVDTLHTLDLKRDGANASNVAALYNTTVQGDYELLGRVQAVGNRLIVEAWGQVIGEVEPAQARYWLKKITAVGGWVWCVFHIHETGQGTEVHYVQVNKSRL